MERKSPRIGVGVLVATPEKLLLGRRKGAHGSGTWSCPGGHLEWGETVAECAARELKEEIGICPLAIQMGPWVENLIDQDKHYVTFFVITSSWNGEILLMEPEKCEEWIWFDWNALPEPLFSPISSLIEKIGFETLRAYFQQAERQESTDEKTL